LEKLDERLSSIAGDPGLIKLEDELYQRLAWLQGRPAVGASSAARLMAVGPGPISIKTH
jgi:hypothetical protein